MSFKQFTQQTSSPEQCALLFITYYERPANPNQPIRQTQARYWYDQFKNIGGEDEVKFEEFKRNIPVGCLGMVFITEDAKMKKAPGNSSEFHTTGGNDGKGTLKKGTAWQFWGYNENWVDVSNKTSWISLSSCVVKENRGAYTGSYIGQKLIFKQLGTTHNAPNFSAPNVQTFQPNSLFIIWKQERDSNKSLWFNIGGTQWINERDVNIQV